MMMIDNNKNEYVGIVDGVEKECVISYNNTKDMYELIESENGKIINKYYSVKREGMVTLANVLTTDSTREKLYVNSNE